MKILVIGIVSIFFMNNSSAQNMRITSPYRVRENIVPILSVINAQNELPCEAEFYNEARKIIVSGSLYSVYNITDNQEAGIYQPAFWIGFVASPNLSLFMQLSHGELAGENINSFGPVFNFIWGKEEKENVLNVSINHMKGPRDFHSKDISLSYMRKHAFDNNNFFYGIAAHYTNAKINNQAESIKQSFNENIYHARLGFYRKINALDCGVELDLSKNTIITKFRVVFII